MVVKMIAFLILNVFIISIPIIFIYCFMGMSIFDISILDTLNSSGSGNIFAIIKMILCYGVFFIFVILPLIYIFVGINLFNISSIIPSNMKVISITDTCKSYLKEYFTTADSQYVENIYNFKDNLLINGGIWFVIFLFLILIQLNIIFSIKSKKNIFYIIGIFIVMFIFVISIVYRSYGTETRVFDDKNNLTSQMTSTNNVNNLLQAIVKYNYPCML